MKISQKQIDAILKLPGQKRYEHFIKVVADWEEAWGLYQGGWALAGTENGRRVFPLWPARVYAEVCSAQEWIGYEPRSIPLDELIDELLPNLEEDGILPAVFYTPKDFGVTPTIDQLSSDLKRELEKY